MKMIDDRSREKFLALFEKVIATAINSSVTVHDGCYQTEYDGKSILV